MAAARGIYERIKQRHQSQLKTVMMSSFMSLFSILPSIHRQSLSYKWHGHKWTYSHQLRADESYEVWERLHIAQFDAVAAWSEFVVQYSQFENHERLTQWMRGECDVIAEWRLLTRLTDALSFFVNCAADNELLLRVSDLSQLEHNTGQLSRLIDYISDAMTQAREHRHTGQLFRSRTESSIPLGSSGGRRRPVKYASEQERERERERESAVLTLFCRFRHNASVFGTHSSMLSVMNIEKRLHVRFQQLWKERHQPVLEAGSLESAEVTLYQMPRDLTFAMQSIVLADMGSVGRGGQSEVVIYPKTSNRSDVVCCKRFTRRIKKPDEDELLTRMMALTRDLITLQHPHIVRYYGLHLQRLPGTGEYELMLFMEYCSNGTMNSSSDELLPMQMSHLVDAVAYIHSKGIVHRDIKCENVFISASGIAKVCAMV
jgi:hypothetical protein